MHFTKLSADQFQVTSNGVYLNSVKGPGMLLIWAEWCPHCHHFLPVFDNLSTVFGPTFPCVAIEHAELEKAPSLRDALQFNGYPTIQFFDQNGKVISTYPGNKGRSKTELMDHICKVYHHCIKHH